MQGFVIQVYLLAASLLYCSSGYLSDQVKRFLGPEMIAVLSEPDKVETYEVKGQRNKEATNRIADFEIITKTRELRVIEITRLQKKLLAESTFRFNQRKRCAFVPSKAFRFIKGDKKVDVLLCFGCREVMFAYKGDQRIEDFDDEEKFFRDFVDKI